MRRILAQLKRATLTIKTISSVLMLRIFESVKEAPRARKISFTTRNWITDSIVTKKTVNIEYQGFSLLSLNFLFVMMKIEKLRKPCAKTSKDGRARF